MTVQQQRALDSLYALDNVLTIKIVPAHTTFANVGVKKKSFCGSLDSEKPCLHLDFGRFGEANVTAAEDVIGSRYLTLNNSIRDRSYVRQPLGYRLLGLAGLPHSRCNYARVFVNGALVGDGFGGVNSPGIYVNSEPVMKRYIERNFGNVTGNLYEFEHDDDFLRERTDFISVESLSAPEDKADLTFAIDRIAAEGLAGADDVLVQDDPVGHRPDAAARQTLHAGSRRTDRTAGA